MSDFDRRTIMAAMVAALGPGSSIAQAASKGTDPARMNGLYSGAAIELYTDRLSAMAGDAVSIHVSSTISHFDLEIVRIGKEAKRVWQRTGLRGRLYPTPEDAWENGCRWPSVISVKIASDWPSGYYEVRATVSIGFGQSETAYAFFVVRPSKQRAKIMLVLTTTTYGAYNNYGGYNFYMSRSADGASTGPAADGGEHRLSFQRPWMPGFLRKPSGYDFNQELNQLDLERIRHLWINRRSGLSLWSNFAGFHNWERVMVEWLEEKGFAVDYATSADLDRDPSVLDGHALMLSVGHDEYWSWRMRDTVETFIKNGGNVCFFSGNNAYWQIRYEENQTKMVCFKHDLSVDPVFSGPDRHLLATHWSSHHIDRSEATLTGLSFVHGGYVDFLDQVPHSAGGYIVYRPEHWVFESSGIKFGDCFGMTSRIVSFEVDGCPIQLHDGLPFPAADYKGPPSFEVLATHPASYSIADKSRMRELGEQIFGKGNKHAVDRYVANHRTAVMGLYKNNGIVFAAGTTNWTAGLEKRDHAVEAVTLNLVKRLSQ